MPPTRVRWWILSLLFLATTINYLDRIAFGILVPEIRKDMLIDDPTYGRLTLAFEMTYMIGFLIMGKFVERYGTRIGYAVAVLWWSVAAVLHGLAKTPLELGFWRGMLGLGEAGVVSEEGPSVCHRDFQRGDQRGVDGGPAGVRLHGGGVWVAGLFPGDGFARICLVNSVVV